MDTLWPKSTSVELSEGENLITTARYGSSKVGGIIGGEVTDHFIYITDKRIVNINNSKDHIVRDEILVDDVAHVRGGIKKVRRFILALLSFLFFIVAAVCVWKSESLGLIPSAVCVGLAVLFLILYLLIGVKTFILMIDCRGTYTPVITVGLSSMVRRRRKDRKVKIKVDIEAADRVLSSIGKVIASKH